MSKGSNRRPAAVSPAVVRQNWDALDWRKPKQGPLARTVKRAKPKKRPLRPNPERCPFCRQVLKRCKACKKLHCTSDHGRGCVPIVRCTNPPKKRNWTKETYETTPQGFTVKRGGMVDGPAHLDTGVKLAGTLGNGSAWDPATAAKRERMRN